MLAALAEKGTDWRQCRDTEKLPITLNRQFIDSHTVFTNTDEITLIALQGPYNLLTPSTLPLEMLDTR